MSDNRPPEGWAGPDRWDHLSFVQYENALTARPPQRDGWTCFFVGRHGLDYVRWTYKREEVTT